jgi:UDP-N-acetylglucosamine 4-epimerase
VGYEKIEFEKDTRFLVTGAAGFIGSNLVEALLNMGYHVRGLDNFSTGKQENIALFADNQLFEFIEGDICDLETCHKACQGIDYVLHQAALGSIPRSIKYPVMYEEVNIGGTVKMMQAAFDAKVKRFIYASSSSVYGDSPRLPKVEGEEGKVLAPYALTKVVNEEYGRLYFQLYDLETIGFRYFNVFGKRQDPYSTYAAVIPIFVKKLLAEEQPIINGDGNHSRDFTYIDNVIEANLKACLAPQKACGKAYNIAFGENTSLNSLYQKLCQLLQKDIEPIYGLERVGDVKHSLADISQAKIMIGYAPSYDLGSGLERAIDWYKEYLA